MSALQPRIRVSAAAAMLALAGAAQAQIVMDGRLGPAGPVAPVGGNYAITHTLGAQVGGNLFHSFSTFNLPTGNVAAFSGNPGTANIVARVTGGSGSSIDGTMRSTIAGANLWFINPWGITFGPNAQLDVSGAFHASTAGYLSLGSGAGRFDAVNPNASNLVSAAPSAFGFMGTPAPLVVDRSALQVPAGKELSLVGGPLEIKGVPALEGILYAPGGRINLASAAGAGEIGLGGAGLSASPGMELGEIRIARTLVSTESPNASALDSGPIYIRAGKLTLEDNARLHSRIAAASTSTGGGGNIQATVSGDIALNDSEIDSGVFSSSTGDGGNISLTAGGSINVTGNSRIRTVSVLGTGNSGNLAFSAASLTVDDSLITAATGGAGTAGGITANVGDLTLRNNGRIRASSIFDGSGTPPTGAAGDITVNATGMVTISGAGSELATSTNGYGTGGSIAVDAGEIRVTSGGRIAAESRDTLGIFTVLNNLGDSGSISLRAAGSIILDAGTVSTFSQTSGAGPIDIRATDTLALRAASITTSTTANQLGNSAGAITIDPVFVILADGSRILTTAVVDNGGPVSITTQFFMMSPDSLIDTSSTFGQSGALTINSPNTNNVGELGALPAGYFDASALLRESCAARAGRAANSFVGAGRGGLPAGPGALAFASYALPPVATAAVPPPLLLASACDRGS